MKQEFVQEGGRNYLKIEGNNTENVGDKLFSYQTIPGFMPMEIEWIDEKKYYVYDVTGKLSFKQYLKKDGVNRQRVQKLMECLLLLPAKLEEYLLDGNDARMMPECIFIDKHSEEIYGVYYPGNDCYGLSAYATIAEFIIEHMNQKDSELAFFVYGLHKRIREQGTTIESLKQYMQAQIPVKSRDSPIEERENSAVNKKQREEHNACCKKVQDEKARYVIPIGILLLGVILPIVLYASGWFDLSVSGNVDWVKTAGAAIFFLGVAAYGAWKLWPKKDINTVWEETSSLSVCLVSCQGKEEPILLSHFPFLLGSEREHVDGVLHAKGVSKIHARFIREGDAFFLLDEESECGTFYNDIRLIPWQKTKVEDGDLLRFGDREYVVEIT